MESPSDEQLLEWLRIEDEASKPLRLARLRFLVEEFGEPRDLLFHGGPTSWYAYEEARLSFLNGQFIGCVLLSQVAVEHILSGLFWMAQREDVCKKGFKNLIDEALKERFISIEEYQSLDLLRMKRNPYTHFKGPEDNASQLRRMLNEDKDYDSITEEDAKNAIKTVFRLLDREPFAFREDDARCEG
jgi:HEPN domain-containing protein